MNQIIFRGRVTQLCKPGRGKYNPTPQMSVLGLIGPFVLDGPGDTDILLLWGTKTQRTKSNWIN